MPNCKCSGSTCGCLVIGGNGTTVSGAGTATQPYVIGLDTNALSIGSNLTVATTPTIEFTKDGSGSFGDPVTISGDVVLHSPNGARWTPSISNTGTVTWGAAGSAGNGGQVPVGSAGGASNGLIFFNGTVWPARNTTANVIWVSLGYNSVPTPPGYIAGDVWLSEAS